jgi:hypothetical protein
VTDVLRRKATILCFLALAVIFWLVNRDAHRGYFSGDDLTTLLWAPGGNTLDWVQLLITPVLNTNNFRPVGSFYYKWIAMKYHLRFRAYSIALQWLHVINAALILILLRRLRFPVFAGIASCCWFEFSAVLLQAFWKPMYVFDVLCCLFCLLTILLYERGHWILGLLTMWLAYRSKEVAVMLPLVVASYEFLLGQKRWKRLIPYFLISLNFGLQALFHKVPESDYSLHFTPQTLLATSTFYGSALLAGPGVVLLALALPQARHDRRLWWGLLSALCLLAPMLILPGRLFEVYWYIPFIGLTVAAAALAAQAPPWTLAIGLTLWMAVNYTDVKERGHALLKEEWEARQYGQDVEKYARLNPVRTAILYDGTPEGLHSWGLQALVIMNWNSPPKVQPAAENQMDVEPGTGLLRWNAERHTLEIISN